MLGRKSNAIDEQLREFEARLRRELLRDKLAAMQQHDEHPDGALPTIHVSLGQLAAANSEIVQSIQSSDVAALLAELTTLYQTAAARGEAVVLVREG